MFEVSIVQLQVLLQELRKNKVVIKNNEKMDFILLILLSSLVSFIILRQDISDFVEAE